MCVCSGEKDSTQNEPSSGQMCHIIQLSLFKASHAKPLFFFITDFLKCISPPTHAYTQAESCKKKKEAVVQRD